MRHTEWVDAFTTSLRDVVASERAYAAEADALAGTCGDAPEQAALWEMIANGHREQAVRYARAADLAALPRA